MTDTVVARRYANAIFALGRKEGDDALTRHGDCLAALGEMIAVAPGLDMTLKSPVISVDEKIRPKGSPSSFSTCASINSFCAVSKRSVRLLSSLKA